MEELPGERAGSRRYYNDGYIDHLDSRTDLFETYRCDIRGGMRCRGMVRVEGVDRRVRFITGHDLHGPNYWSVEEAQMKIELLELCRTTLDPLGHLYIEVAARYD